MYPAEFFMDADKKYEIFSFGLEKIKSRIPLEGQ